MLAIDATTVFTILTGIKWSLRASASMRALRLFLRARATVIKYVLQLASTLKNTDGEQRALCKFSGRTLDLSYWEKEMLCAK